MTEVTNGQLQMSAQEIQNNLEQVSKNQTSITNIGNRLLELREQTVQYIKQVDPNKARQYRNSGIKQSVILGDALILATSSYYFYILDSQTIKEYRFDDSFYERTICSFNNAVIDDIITGLKIRSINQPNNTVIIEPGLNTSMATIQNNLTVGGKTTTKDLEITDRTINGLSIDNFALNDNVYQKNETYSQTEINQLVKSHGVCSLSRGIQYETPSSTTNSNGTISLLVTIHASSLDSDYSKMNTYQPIVLSLEGTNDAGNAPSFTKLVSNQKTEEYIWNPYGSHEFKVVFDITTASFIITGSTSAINTFSTSCLPTTITFKYL